MKWPEVLGAAPLLGGWIVVVDNHELVTTRDGAVVKSRPFSWGTYELELSAEALR